MTKPSLYQRLFSDISDLLAVVDRNHRLVMCNWRGGYDYVPEDKRTGQPHCYEVFYPGQNGPCQPCHVMEVFRTGKPLVTEKYNARVGHLEVRCFPIFDEAGELTMVAEQLCDINQRKAALENLHASERQYRTLVESQIDLVCRWQPDTTLTFVNSAYCRFFGKTRAELLGTRFLDNCPQEFRPDLAAHVASQAQNPRLEVVEVKVYDTKGRIRWQSWCDCPIFDEQGRLVEFQSVGRDITKEKMALEHLRETQTRYRHFFENDLTGDFVVGIDGQLVDCNPAFLRIFGFDSRQQALEKDFFELFFHGKDPGIFFEILQQQKKMEYCDIEGCKCDGSPLQLIANLLGQFNEEGQLTGIEGFLFDNTDLKNLQKQFLHAQKMEAMGRLAGGVAHDFNNLLTVISGYSQYLLQKYSDEALQGCLEQIVKAGEQAASLTSQLLAFSRRQVMQTKEMDLNGVTADMEKMLHRILGADVDLVVLRDPRLGLVNADRGQIEQVIVNLAVNARDAMPEGGKLTIETINIELDEIYSTWHTGLAPGHYVMMSVTDTGIGMDPEIMGKIFEPFYTTKETGKGTGLGLSTVYGIVQQSGGHIYVYSEPGMGTTFKIYLPRVDSPVHDRAAKECSSLPIKGSETILLVEDNESVRDLAHMVLRGNGYNVLEACDIHEALQVFETYDDAIHLLLTDVVMPGGSGPTLVAELRGRKADLKVLYVSGYPQDTQAIQDSETSKDAFLAKPFTPISLGLKVREILG
ncbi:sensor histidine kinase response regulator, PAS and PAS domain-containing, putative heme-binding site [Syntrophotalea carbinolica DSM 2380]|uniref:histidine kinase n=1 Tax=Syntrophotalea carbinolica (strain DSM 2380 / NBRC 103641 / GraBd1) TaxID=338963 RepID=Q3A850_SYNC1|nr:PAS domain S-box protein [Syntrophotalea carbinolica]ABA87442.1 sensor histidine kinase response regulator, PAS and PAS domain-containing, putative heme-binding site [Syntrophotalea carbinolica DSM 2380]